MTKLKKDGTPKKSGGYRGFHRPKNDEKSEPFTRRIPISIYNQVVKMVDDFVNEYKSCKMIK